MYIEYNFSVVYENPEVRRRTLSKNVKKQKVDNQHPIKFFKILSWCFAVNVGEIERKSDPELFLEGALLIAFVVHISFWCLSIRPKKNSWRFLSLHITNKLCNNPINFPTIHRKCLCFTDHWLWNFADHSVVHSSKRLECIA